MIKCLGRVEGAAPAHDRGEGVKDRRHTTASRLAARDRLREGDRRTRGDALPIMAEVDAAGLAYERAVFDLAAEGVHIRSSPPSRSDSWVLVATCVGPADSGRPFAALRAYFGSRLRRCHDDWHPEERLPRD